MKFDFNSILQKIKDNKKMTIIIGVFVALVLLLLIVSRTAGSANSFFSSSEEIHNMSYVADGTINIGNKSLNLNMQKNETDYFLSLSNNEVSYPGFITKTGNLIYLNNELVEENTGLLTINKVQSEEAVELWTVLFDAMSNSEYIEYIDEGNSSIIKIDTTENWKGFWTDINLALTDNADFISSGYQNKEEIKTVLDSFISNTKKWADTETIANTIEIEIITEESGYSLNFEILMDLSLLPGFANQEDIDSNKFSFSGAIKITPIEAVEIKKPSGAIHASTSAGISGFLSSLWDSIFAKTEYVSFVDIKVTNNSVTATYNLGNTTESLTLVFDNKGVSSGNWFIKSSDKAIIESYIEKMRTEDNNKYMQPVNVDEYSYTLTVPISESGISSFNKMAQNPSKMADYLSSSKGGELIV